MTSNVPAVSVIIPFYNAARFVRETLESVFAQIFRDFEIVCVDDGSTDDSLAIIADAASAHGQAVRVVRGPRGGNPMAKNRGAGEARGQYLAFLDADDLWYPRKLQQQAEVLEKNPQAVLVHCDFDEIDEAGHLLRRCLAAIAQQASRKDPWVQLIGPYPWILPSVMMVRRTAFERIGGFDPTLWYNEEADLCLRLRSLGEFVFLEDAGTAKRVHPASMSREGDTASRKLSDGARFLHKLELRFANDPANRRLVHLLLASNYSDWGWQKVRSGKRREVMRLLTCALRYHPSRVRTYSRLVRSCLPSGLSRLLSKRR